MVDVASAKHLASLPAKPHVPWETRYVRTLQKVLSSMFHKKTLWICKNSECFFNVRFSQNTIYDKM